MTDSQDQTADRPEPSPQPNGRDDNANAGPRAVIIGPDGQLVDPADLPPDAVVVPAQQSPKDLIGEPAKVMRIGTMIKQLLEEVRNAPLDEASRSRLKEIHARSIAELEEGLTPELHDELERLSLPFADDAVPSESELRIAQAQLVGWLEGVFHGLQTALVAQQMNARSQLEQMRRGALPPGAGESDGPTPGTGQYL